VQYRQTLTALRAALVFALLILAVIDSAVRSQTIEPSAAARSPLFTIKSYMGRCLNVTPHMTPPAALSIADCDGSVNQQFSIKELDSMHHVQVHGAGACIGAQAATDGAAVTLQPCSSSAETQIFDLDGDSILLDSNPDLVVQLKNSVTRAGTPVVLGRRLLSDVEFWDIISLDVPPRSPTSGFVTVESGSSLRGALHHAGPNTVIQIPPGTLIEFDDLPQPLEIPEGVTLRGDRRGVLLGPQIWLTKGHNSTGPDDDPGLFLMQASRSRITGLRIRGPGRGVDYPQLKGVNMVVGIFDPSQPDPRIYFSELVDHNDISDWGALSAVDLKGPDADAAYCPMIPPSGPQPAHVFRNFIHDNHAGNDGYGVDAGSGAYPLVFANMFQKNTHSVTTDGYAKSGYMAVANLFASGNVSADADVHGERGYEYDGCSGHEGGISGMAAQVVDNTFLRASGGNFSLRGRPCSGVTATFQGNVTTASATDSVTVVPPGACDSIPWTQARPRVPYLNVDSKFSIPDPVQTFLVGDFDGDGKDDVFLATGAAWYYSPGANAEWRFLSAKTETTDTLLIGDFDGDGIADVFKQSGDDWFVSWGGRSDWQLLSSNHRVNMMQLPDPDIGPPDHGLVNFVIGHFVSDKRADVFFADGRNWWVSAGGTAPFELYFTSPLKREDLAFGDFDGGGRTEVTGVEKDVVTGDNLWMYVTSQAPRQWTPLRSAYTMSLPRSEKATIIRYARPGLSTDRTTISCTYSAAGSHPPNCAVRFAASPEISLPIPCS
jgi:hypothetical protein